MVDLVLLTIPVFMLMVADKMPQASESIPVIIESLLLLVVVMVMMLLYYYYLILLL